MQNTPLVSVLMTVYNRQKYIAEAIESVLASRYTHFELIIVDDCSTDQSLEIARTYEVKDDRVKVYVNENNLKQFPNRNKAASYAKGKYIKYLDSDDLIYPFGLDILVDALEKYPNAAIAIASQDTHPTELHYPKLVSSEEAYEIFFFRNSLLTIGPSGVMFSKEKFEESGGYSDSYATGDTELMLKLAAKYPVVRVQPSFFYYRVHDSQVLNSSNKLKTYAIESYKIGISSLENTTCPLSDDKVKMAKNILIKRIVKISAYQILRKGRIKKGFEILNVIFLS